MGWRLAADDRLSHADVCRDGLESLCSVADVGEVGVRKRSLTIIGGRPAPNLHQLLSVGVWERTEHDGVYDAEYGAVESDPNGGG